MGAVFLAIGVVAVVRRNSIATFLEAVNQGLWQPLGGATPRLVAIWGSGFLILGAAILLRLI